MTLLRPVSILSLLAAALLSACASVPPGPTTADVSQLLSLQKTRLDVATPVARSKWNTGAPIDDPVREGVILDDVASRAQKAGVDAQWARRFFQDQFDAGKIVQRDLHRQWKVERQPPFTNPPDLARDVRPILDRLTPELLATLGKVSGHLCEPAVAHALAQLTPEILGADYPPAVQDKATEALRCRR